MNSQASALLVEDNPDDIDLIRHAFRKAEVPHQLDVVEDGGRAIPDLAGRTASGGERLLPAVVLLDLKLPRQSGFAVMKWIRANPVLRHVPVVILTSSSQDKD